MRKTDASSSNPIESEVMKMFMRVVNTGSQHGNCYVLKSNNGEMLLLDCGCKYKDILKAIDYRTSDVSGVLLTHEHG